MGDARAALLPACAPGFPPYSSGARLPRTAVGRGALARCSTGSLARGPSRGATELNEARGAGRACRRSTRLHGGISRELAPRRDVPAARVPADVAQPWVQGDRAADVGAAVRGRRAAARATSRSCWWRRARRRTREQRLLRAALEGLARRAGARAGHAPTGARPPGRVAVPANARLVDWLSYSRTMPRCDAGGLPRRPRHGGARAGLRRAAGRLPRSRATWPRTPAQSAWAGVLGHVARRRAGDDRAAAGQGPHQRSVPRVADDERRARHRPWRRRSSRPAGRSPGTGSGAAGGRRFQVASTRTGSPRQPRQRGAQQPVRRVLGGGGRDDHERVLAGRRLDVVDGGSHTSGPTTCTHGGHTRGYSSWGKVAIRHSSREIPPYSRDRGGSPSRARASRSAPRGPRRSPRLDAAAPALPQPRPSRVRGQPRPDRVGREARARRRVAHGGSAWPPARPRARPPSPAPE